MTEFQPDLKFFYWMLSVLVAGTIFSATMAIAIVTDSRIETVEIASR